MAIEGRTAVRDRIRAATTRTGPDTGTLPVRGRLPAALDGALCQQTPHPGRPAPGGCAHLVSGSFRVGVRLDGGAARWHRERTPRPGLSPTLPATAALRTALPGVSIARPVLDPSGSELHTVAIHPGLPFGELLVGRPDGTLLRGDPFPLAGAPLQHAVAVTDRWVVVLDLPVTHRESAALLGGFPWRWTPGRPARIGLLPRDGAGPARWLGIEPCFVLHLVGAHEDGVRVVLDGVRHERAFDPAGGPGSPVLWRWELDPRSGTVVERQLDDHAVELPAVDTRVRDRAHRLVWTVEQRAGAIGTAGPPGGDLAGAAVLRHQLAGASTVDTVRYALGPGRRAGEPVFVPAGPDAAEGEGWLLVMVDDALADRAELLVLDAGDLAPVAAVPLPVRLPAGLHGDWLPARAG